MKKYIFLAPKLGVASFFLLFILQGCSATPTEKQYPGFALFEDRCQKIAGEKIYRKVENVEGIFLINIRKKPSKILESINYPGAALALEEHDDGYIETFLSYEHSSFGPGGKVTPQNRGFVNRAYLLQNPVNIAGYKFVDAIDPNDGLRYRYEFQRNEKTKKQWIIDNKMERSLATDKMPRYGVYFEDHVIPSERKFGLASTTIRVIDMSTKEILGEFTAYAYGGAVDFENKNQKINWLAASKCPQKSGSANARTRQFVDQVLIPQKHD